MSAEDVMSGECKKEQFKGATTIGECKLKLRLVARDVNKDDWSRLEKT